MYAFLPGHFRMEGGGQQPAGTHCDNSSRPGQRGAVGCMLGIGWFNLGQDFHPGAHTLHPWTADEDGMDRSHTGVGGAEVQAFEVQVRLEGFPLASEGVAADGHVQPAECLLGSARKVCGGVGNVRGQQDHACAGTVNRQSAGDAFTQWFRQPEGTREFVDGCGLAARDDEPIQAVEFLGTPDADPLGAGFRGGTEMLAEVALKRQDADPKARAHACGIGGKGVCHPSSIRARCCPPARRGSHSGGCMPRLGYIRIMSFLSVPLGKLVRRVSRLRGGGSALPGLIVEKIDPGFMRRTLTTLPHGVAVVSGTNGKTTTTKMVVELLESQGLKVFTNRTGSNFTRGVAAALLGEVDWRGRLNADVAVLELDEAHAVHFVNSVPPKYCLLLNVLRDQLDRFGEIDKTAQLLQHIAAKTTGTVVLNREDPRVARIAETLTGQEVRYFGLDDSLLGTFPNDDDMRAAPGSPAPAGLPEKPAADVVLRKVGADTAEFEYDGGTVSTAMKLRGVYNIFNAAAALTLARGICGGAAADTDHGTLLAALSQVAPAFGRGESLTVEGQPLDLVLVKNPSGFRLGLKSFPAGGYATMIAINDNYADGRDMSWLWDVEFDSLRDGGVDQLTGSRAYDMALRLQYDDVRIGAVEPDIAPALAAFIRGAKGQPKRIFCTYTAMLAIRRELSKITTVEVVS